jgi:hypothetical protein
MYPGLSFPSLVFSRVPFVRHAARHVFGVNGYYDALAYRANDVGTTLTAEPFGRGW